MLAVLKPGSIIASPCPVSVFFCWHYGIVSDRRGYVIHSSRRRGFVVEEPVGEFAEGRGLYSVGYPSRLPPRVVLGRARSRIGRRWDLLDNCEHFVRFAHAMTHKSNEGRRALVLGAVAVATVATALRT